MLIISIVIGVTFGSIYYALPKNFTGIGSFYVTRRSENSTLQYFNYEGYYSQQAALSYTNTIVALLESYDIRNKSMQKLGIPTTEESLRKYGKLIKVKKVGPQIITLTIKESTKETAQKLWNTVANTLIEESKKMNAEGDTNLSIAKISENIVIKKSYDSVALDLLLGALGGLLASSFVVIFKETYFK